MKLSKKSFVEQANKIRVSLTPMLNIGVVYGIKQKEFEERLELIETKIMNLDTVAEVSEKEEIAKKAKQELIDYIIAHNKKAETN